MLACRLVGHRLAIGWLATAGWLTGWLSGWLAGCGHDFWHGFGIIVVGLSWFRQGFGMIVVWFWHGLCSVRHHGKIMPWLVIDCGMVLCGFGLVLASGGWGLGSVGLRSLTLNF
jgi:hypothetical protein